MTKFYVAVEQTNLSVPAMAVPVIIDVGLSASAELGNAGGPNPGNVTISTGAQLQVNGGSLIPAPHLIGLTQVFSAGDTCSLAGCDSSVCDPVGGCTVSPPSTNVALEQGFVPGDTLFLLTMIAQGSGGGFVEGDFNATVDPHIFIDPSFAFADDFKIVLSPNILTAATVSAVPEPMSALLLGPAALLLGFALKLRKRAKLQRPLPNGSLRIVALGAWQDAAA